MLKVLGKWHCGTALFGPIATVNREPDDRNGNTIVILEETLLPAFTSRSV